jgi:hypothetical protein
MMLQASSASVYWRDFPVVPLVIRCSAIFVIDQTLPAKHAWALMTSFLVWILSKSNSPLDFHLPRCHRVPLVTQPQAVSPPKVRQDGAQGARVSVGQRFGLPNVGGEGIGEECAGAGSTQAHQAQEDVRPPLAIRVRVAKQGESGYWEKRSALAGTIELGGTGSGKGESPPGYHRPH